MRRALYRYTDYYQSGSRCTLVDLRGYFALIDKGLALCQNENDALSLLKRDIPKARVEGCDVLWEYSVTDPGYDEPEYTGRATVTASRREAYETERRSRILRAAERFATPEGAQEWLKLADGDRPTLAELRARVGRAFDVQLERTEASAKAITKLMVDRARATRQYSFDTHGPYLQRLFQAHPTAAELNILIRERVLDRASYRCLSDLAAQHEIAPRSLAKRLGFHDWLARVWNSN